MVAMILVVGRAASAKGKTREGSGADERDWEPEVRAGLRASVVACARKTVASQIHRDETGTANEIQELQFGHTQGHTESCR